MPRIAKPTIVQQEWSVKTIQDLILPRDAWEKKHLYATDSEKCPRGLYYALKGEEPTNPIDPAGLRRMEVGEMIETNQVKKLKSLGIMLSTQMRIEDLEHNVSGRIDSLIISPEHCTKQAKKLIKEKQKIFKELETLSKNFWKGLGLMNTGEITREDFNNGRNELRDREDALYASEREMNDELMIPNEENHLMVIEMKSISEWGFKYRQTEGTPMSSHEKQALFYLWKLREQFPNIVARVLYIGLPYQELLEFDIPMDELKLNELKKFWDYINSCLKKNVLPVVAADVELSTNGKYKLNHQAEWCNYHIKCTGDPNWKTKALDKVRMLNGGGKTMILR